MRARLPLHLGKLLGARHWTFQIDQPGRFLPQTDGEPQAVPAHVAVGQEIGGSLAVQVGQQRMKNPNECL
jgi:hypothetical protein